MGPGQRLVRAGKQPWRGWQMARGWVGTEGVVGVLVDGGLQGQWGAWDAVGLGGGGFPRRVPRPSLGQPPEVRLSRPQW